MACCEEKIEMNDILFRDYWDRVYSHLSDLMCDAENFECFGNQDGATESYDMMNDIWYMFVYGQLAYQEQVLRTKNLYPESTDDCVDSTATKKEIWEEFGFDCKVEYFKCKHKIDLKEILSGVFGLGTSMGKGIDYMRIENNDDCIPTFKIV
jgi:hypothetical protein